MITKEITFDHQILEDGQIQVREITRLMEDGKELSKTFHRHVVAPGDSGDNEDERTVQIMATLHEPESINTYKNAANANREAAAKNRVISLVDVHGVELIKEALDDVIADLELIEDHEDEAEELVKKATFMEKLNSWLWDP